MNKVIMITGANAGIGKETARQLGKINTTEKIYLACRNLEKAKVAQEELEELTGRKVFEIIIMDVSQPDSVKKAIAQLDTSIDALIMNAGGLGGKTPEKATKDGVTTITASNLLGHVVLVDELIKNDKLKNIALYASSEVARGVKKMGMEQYQLKQASVDEFTSLFDGSAFGKKFDPVLAYSGVKLSGTLWMSSMARKYPNIKFISVSPGGTRGTDGFNDMPFLQRIMYKYVGMPIIMPLLGLSHSLESGAKRFVQSINNEKLESGVFYASKKNVLTGPLVDQSPYYNGFSNPVYQDNANEAIHRFIN
ncbi:SDR family NAD(P)-dependent oxidoreductase [Flammeovirga sp. SJP92]|uniref:SDR family NAD(P)-dependent oxidoreductase n=1 Tax=Flammeovirga sp. SJP92 TaxID=1775430 RepID=UPI00078864F6|nr:SDR family NAD(P)-dependent oxidoreductase [Flammeovirga sp. SJP92]KXX69990.1 short-chain dehydrogenase [Flammeovirga sp. SJP92]